MAVKKSEKEKGTQQPVYAKVDLPVLIYVLKAYASPQYPVSAAQLAGEMSAYLGEVCSEKRVRGRLEEIVSIQNWEEEPGGKERKYRETLAQILFRTLGGRVVKTQPKTVKERGTDQNTKRGQSRYYFEPCLDEASARLLSSTVTSNAFLARDEKEYLLSRMKMLNLQGEVLLPPDEEEEGPKGAYGRADILPMDKPNKDADEQEVALPGEAAAFLDNIEMLDKAIRSEWQIEITYGTFGIYEDERSGACHMDYRARELSPGQVRRYRINPYALCWSRGHYYLIATYVKGNKPSYVSEEGTPIHFRSDRIITIDPVMRKGKDGKNAKSFAKREKIPPRLTPFFKRDEDNVWIFDAYTYVARYPGMRISRREELIDGVIECAESSIQILVDYFGSKLSVRYAKERQGAGEVDINGRPQIFIEATVKDVEFENMRDFCLTHCEYITPAAPPKLVEAVKTRLERVAERYR